MSKIRISLIIANIILGFAIYLSFKGENKQRENFNEILISTLSNLDSVRLESGNASKVIKLTKVSANWMITEPYEWQINKLALSNFQTKLAHFNTKKLYELSELRNKGEILEDYGVHEFSPRIKVSHSENFIEFIIGDITRDEKSCYSLIHLSQLNKKFIYKIDKEIINFSQTKPRDWTEGSFIKTPLYAIDNVSITFGNETNLSSHVNLTKKEQKWFFTKPFNGESDTEKVLLQLNSLISANVVKFEKEEWIQNSESTNWKAKLEISGFNQTEIVNFNLNADETITGKTQSIGTRFILEKDFFSLLNDWSTKLRSRTIFQFSSSNLQNLEVIHEDRTILISKNSDQNWKISESNSSGETVMDADQDKIQSFFREINSATVDQFLATSIDLKLKEEFKIEDPIYRINYMNSDSSSNSFYFTRTRDTEQMWTVIDQNQSVICLIEKDFNKLLDIKPLTFRHKSLLPKDFNTSNIIISNNDSNSSLTFDLPRISKETQSLLNFSAETFIDSTFLKDGTWVGGDWIPWKYNLSFSNSDMNNSQRLDFQLSERKGATIWYGGDPNSKLIFKLPINTIDEIQKAASQVD